MQTDKQKRDLAFMRQAMELSLKGAGAVNPNPLVGALVVRGEQVIAQGYHARYGDLHAERNAFRDADSRKVDCKGATMYVTLEPCCHHGHQPPCTEAVIAHGIARVVVGLFDPNPMVAGKGLNLLRDAGIEVCMIHDIPGGEALEEEMKYQNRVFLKYITTQQPWVVAKWAMTLDGKIASHTGHSQWVSGELSRQRVQEMRRNLKGILCGIGTVLADDPMLNCRLEGNPRQPVRMVVDRQLRIPLDCQLVKTAGTYRTIVVHAPAASEEKKQLLQKAGVETWCCSSLQEMLEKAGKEKIDGILLEGGGILNEAFLREGLIDEVVAFIAPKLIGGTDAKTPVEGEGFSLMSQAVQLHRIQTEILGNDIVIRGLVSRS